MFNPPAALLAARVLEGRAASAARRAPLLDDPWLDPLTAVPPVPQPPPRRRRAAWNPVAFVASARRLR